MRNYIPNYPRPQLLRERWTLLDGAWDFAFDDSNVGEMNGWQRDFPKQYDIQVPFTYETPASGIGIEDIHENAWYSRTFVPEEHTERVLLHFEGSDYHTRVFLNGHFAGEHKGGYARFSFDITDLLIPGENTLTVHVTDTTSRAQPRGKQRWVGESFGCWYVQTTGIWKSVWLEYAPVSRITNLKITPQVADGAVRIEATCTADANGAILAADAFFEGIAVGSSAAEVKDGKADILLDVRSTEVDPWGLKKWSPDHPHLYDLTVVVLQNGRAADTVCSYFGMRDISIHNARVLLNGYPLYQRLLLDQGYWKTTHLTPPSEEAIITDIEKIQQLGYNGVRKHQKVEDERFLYWADVKGLLVWSEFPATLVYNDEAIENVTREWLEVVRQNYSHPSIITWTPFNESWGVADIENDPQQQKFTESIYALTKAIDPMRPVVTNDGWRHTCSDILTLHDYEASGEKFYDRYIEPENFLDNSEPYSTAGQFFAFADGYEYEGQPIIISEFGGIALSSGEGWGYGDKVEGEEAFLERFESITRAIQDLPYCSGYCYTQVTDVQQEVNGLMDMDRNFKVDPEKIRAINLAKK